MSGGVATVAAPPLLRRGLQRGSPAAGGGSRPRAADGGRGGRKVQGPSKSSAALSL
jgi:hypothetical protein